MHNVILNEVKNLLVYIIVIHKIETLHFVQGDNFN